MLIFIFKVLVSKSPFIKHVHLPHSGDFNHFKKKISPVLFQCWRIFFVSGKFDGALFLSAIKHSIKSEAIWAKKKIDKLVSALLFICNGVAFYKRFWRQKKFSRIVLWFQNFRKLQSISLETTKISLLPTLILERWFQDFMITGKTWTLCNDLGVSFLLIKNLWNAKKFWQIDRTNKENLYQLFLNFCKWNFQFY